MLTDRMMPRIKIGPLLLTTALAAGCNAQTQSASTGGDGGRTSGDASVTVGCPATAPAANSPCTKEGQYCEYGADWDPTCDTIVACQNGVWGTPILFTGTTGVCGSSSPPSRPPNPSDCPATRAALPSGQSCATQSTCSYDGSSCSCGVFCPSYPIAMPPCDADAGITTSCCDRSAPPTWYCFDGPPYCPTPRPRVGDPCNQVGQQCAIAPPAECGQEILQCTSGTWQLPISECPISTARAKRDIAYLSPGDAARLRDQLMGVRLARYTYKSGDPSTHLGFIIEDMPKDSPAVLASRDRVDLYGYVSMTVAAIKEQQKQIDALNEELARVKRECHSPR
jgi:hypothetical protein